MSESNISTEQNEDLLVSNDDANFTITDDSMWGNPKTIDFDKVQTLEDVINVLKAMDMRIYNHEDERFDNIRHLLKDCE